MSEGKGGNPTGDKSVVSKANKARNNAVRQLITENEERYTQILGEQRETLGLSKDPTVEKRRDEVRKYAEKLKSLGVNVNLDEMLNAIS